MKTDIEGPRRPAVAIASDVRTVGTAAKGVPESLPSIREVAARCALPLIMGLLILGTVLWGGFVTFVMALALWKAAGAVL